MYFGTMHTRVKQYLDRSDVDDKIVNWINDTRVDIALRYNFNYLYVEASAATVAGTKRYSLPSDYLGHLVLWCANKKLVKLEGREADDLTKTDSEQTAYPRTLTVEGSTEINASITSGPPDYYFERGMEFELYPTPNAVYTMTISYYQQPATWAAAQTATNAYDYMSTFHFETIIWGACARGAAYLDDEEDMQRFQKLYDDSVMNMIRREKDSKQQDMTYRMRTYKDYDLTQFKRRMKVTA